MEILNNINMIVNMIE